MLEMISGLIAANAKAYSIHSSYMEILQELNLEFVNSVRLNKQYEYKCTC
jgi:hypothetical protein